MARKAVRAVVVCEDREQRSFLGRLLESLGVTPIRYEVAPQGEGAAEQWVLQTLSGRGPDLPEVRRPTRRTPGAGGHGRRRSIRHGRPQDRVRRRAPRAVVMRRGGPTSALRTSLPTWSIETWIAWLSAAAHELDGFGEATPYKSHPGLGIDGWPMRRPPRPHRESARWTTAASRGGLGGPFTRRRASRAA